MSETKLGQWDFEGKCAPNEDGGNVPWPTMETFSLGCFQWVRRGSGTGLKKGRVLYRIKGRVDNPKAAYDAARAYCAAKNAPSPILEQEKGK